MSSRDALNRAEDEGLDLVVVAATAQPVVCRIVDYGKFKYEQEKQKKDQKRKTQEVKGIKISPRIAEHDIGHLLKNAHRFLEEGHKVKITCQFRAREVAHPELGKRKLDAMAEKLLDVGTVERQPTLDGKLMIMVLSPKPQTGKKKDAKAEDKQDSGKEVQDHRQGEDHPSEGV